MHSMHCSLKAKCLQCDMLETVLQALMSRNTLQGRGHHKHARADPSMLYESLQLQASC
jgi:hypothetical protein